MTRIWEWRTQLFCPWPVFRSVFRSASYCIRAKRGGWKHEVADIGFTDKWGLQPKDQVLTLRGKSNPPMGWPLDGKGEFKGSDQFSPAKLNFWDAPEADWSGVALT